MAKKNNKPIQLSLFPEMESDEAKLQRLELKHEELAQQNRNLQEENAALQKQIAELEKNNVTVLKDDIALIADKLNIVGRNDKSDSGRKPISELLKGIDKSKYTIVLDHQPNDYKNESEADIDLVFSGHTHGGHLWPAGYIGLLIRANDAVYGAEEFNGKGFIVTSGISGWAIPFKTGTKCEYVVMDIYHISE